MKRVRAYIDGFNLYHAIVDLRRPELKWLDLWSMIGQFVDASSQRLDAVYYFSAYATWLKDAHKRHQSYVAALRARGVTCFLADFYSKPMRCHTCKAKWTAHEEKRSDVNAAISLVEDAYEDRYDRALLVTGDSDLVPAVKLVGERFPEKRVVVLSPPGRNHSGEIARCVKDRRKQLRRIDQHVARCLLPEHVTDAAGAIVAQRPREYAPK